MEDRRKAILPAGYLGQGYLMHMPPETFTSKEDQAMCRSIYKGSRKALEQLKAKLIKDTKNELYWLLLIEGAEATGDFKETEAWLMRNSKKSMGAGPAWCQTRLALVYVDYFRSRKGKAPVDGIGYREEEALKFVPKTNLGILIHCTILESDLMEQRKYIREQLERQPDFWRLRLQLMGAYYSGYASTDPNRKPRSDLAAIEGEKVLKQVPGQPSALWTLALCYRFTNPGRALALTREAVASGKERFPGSMRSSKLLLQQLEQDVEDRKTNPNWPKPKK